MNFGIRPLHDRIIVKREEASDHTPGGIYLPQGAQETPRRGTVVAVGNGRKLDDGDTVPMSVAVGDKVIFGRYAGAEVEVKNEKYFIMRETDVVGVIEDDIDVTVATDVIKAADTHTFYQK